MKKVSGTLRIDLASYRELEAFTQFGSDLDAATQQKLNRGKRTVEVLKQDLHSPITVEAQIAILFALTQGVLDSVAVSDIKAFEKGLVDYLYANAHELMQHIQKTGTMPNEEELLAHIKDYRAQFVPNNR